MSLVFLMLCWLGGAVTPPATVLPRLELRLSPSQPLVGQEARLCLSITWPAVPDEGGELTAAWLVPEPSGWVWLMPLDQLLCQQQVPLPQRTLPLRLAGQRWRLPIVLQPDGSAQLELMLPLRLTEPEAELSLSPVQLRLPNGLNVTSNRLLVQPRRPTWAAAAPGQWRLGLGRFKVQAEVAPQQLFLGETLALTLGVEGPGVADLPRPPLTKLQALGPSAWRIEALPETWQGDQRRFRFRLWPVQPRPLQPLALLRCQAYDPDLDRTIDFMITLPEVAVLQPPPPSPRAGHNQAWADQEPLLEPEAAWDTLQAGTGPRLCTWTLAVVVTLTSLWTCAGRPSVVLWPRWLPRPWSQATRAAWAVFQSAADPAAGSQALITTYLRHRLGWSLAQPTVAELTARLAGQCPDSLLEETLNLWRLGDAARFGPQPTLVDWPRRIRAWLAAWEAVT